MITTTTFPKIKYLSGRSTGGKAAIIVIRADQQELFVSGLFWRELSRSTGVPRPA